MIVAVINAKRGPDARLRRDSPLDRYARANASLTSGVCLPTSVRYLMLPVVMRGWPNNSGLQPTPYSLPFATGSRRG